MAASSEEKPKIIIDNDWKSQVEAEKEELRRREQASGQAAPVSGAKPQAAGGEGERESEGALPPASLAFLVTSLATQAMAALGQIPDPLENKPVVRLAHARHCIDLLGVLEEKTQGNLTSEERDLLAHVLTDLRMAFVAVERHVKANPARS